MKLKSLMWRSLKICLIAVLVLSGLVYYVLNRECSDNRITRTNAGTSLGIVEHWGPEVCSDTLLRPVSLPVFEPGSRHTFRLDWTFADLSALDLGGSRELLCNSNFGTRTVWPVAMPEGMDPDSLMELGKNPGLGVRGLHRRGITGRGIGIAIIDQPLLVEHAEYYDRLKFYEILSCSPPGNWPLPMHGAGVASIAAGKSCGVAPESDLYYIAANGVETFFGSRLPVFHFSHHARAIRRLIDINRTLPPENRIRVISISLGILGFGPLGREKDELREALKLAADEGIFVISCSLGESHGLRYMGLGRDPFSDPDRMESYGPGRYWKSLAKRRQYSEIFGLMVPMDSRCVASPLGAEDYDFYPSGGDSWAVPYLAGLYALACQADPNITPERFWELALETGDTMECEYEGWKYSLEKIANPVRLIERIQAAAGADQIREQANL